MYGNRGLIVRSAEETKEEKMRLLDDKKRAVLVAASAFALLAGGLEASAYDGTVCKAPGNCWEPKPGYPDKVAGSKYDPKHDPKEIGKQAESIRGMEERNRKRVEHFKKTGQFIYDVTKIPN